MNNVLRVTARGLNLRTGSGTEHPVSHVLPGGAILRQINPPWRSQWLRVSYVGPGGVAVAGYVHGAYVAESYMDRPPPFAWHARARLDIGVREIAGKGDNPRIVHYHSFTSLKATEDEVPWCSSFACCHMEEVGISSTGSAAARSWLTWGRVIEEPFPGCVVVFKRGRNPRSGHVALFEHRDGDRIHVLGGNQGNAVKVSAYRAADLLGYRMPA